MHLFCHRLKSETREGEGGLTMRGGLGSVLKVWDMRLLNWWSSSKPVFSREGQPPHGHHGNGGTYSLRCLCFASNCSLEELTESLDVLCLESLWSDSFFSGVVLSNSEMEIVRFPDWLESRERRRSRSGKLTRCGIRSLIGRQQPLTRNDESTKQSPAVSTNW